MLGGSGQLRARIVVQFVLLAVAWGSSFLFIKIGLRELSPTQVTLARMLFGALALGLLVAITRRPVPRDPRIWGHLTVVAMLLCLIPFTLFSWAEQNISSGLASIFNATTPLFAMAFAAVMLASEHITRHRLLGLGLGFLGVVTIIGPWSGLGTGNELLPQLACVAATSCYGLAFAYLRRFVTGRGVPATSVAFVQVLLGAVIMIIGSPWVASDPIEQLSTPVVLSMIALGAFGTGMAYVWNTNIVTAWGAANAAAVTYLSPVVGVALGIVVLGEPLTWNQPVGAALVILGIIAAHGRLPKPTQRTQRPATTHEQPSVR